MQTGVLLADLSSILPQSGGQSSWRQHKGNVHFCCLQKLKVLDVTMGTSVSLADGFQIAPEQGVWNVPAGAVLYAPHVAVSSLSMTTTTNNSAFG